MVTLFQLLLYYDACHFVPVVLFMLPHWFAVKSGKLHDAQITRKQIIASLSYYKIRPIMYSIGYCVSKLLPQFMERYTYGTLREVFLETTKFIVVLDFLFYVQHYCMHTKWMYKHIHFEHHLFRQTFPLASEAGHYIDSLTLGVCILLSAYFVNPKTIQSIYTSIAILRWHSVESHCGYDLGFYRLSFGLLSSSPVHATHHTRVVGNYGTFFTIWDRLFGTYIGEQP